MLAFEYQYIVWIEYGDFLLLKHNCLDTNYLSWGRHWENSPSKSSVAFSFGQDYACNYDNERYYRLRVTVPYVRFETSIILCLVKVNNKFM